MRDVLKIMGFCALVFAAGFLWFCSELTQVEEVHPDSVNLRFRSAVVQFEDPTPMRVRDASGHVLHLRCHDPRIVPGAPTDLVVMVWRGPDSGFVETRLPIWLLGMWEPARDYMLRDSRFDPVDWGLSVAEIQTAGPGVVIDHVDRSGSRLLVWAE